MSGRLLSDGQFPLTMGQRRWPVAPGQDNPQKGMVVDWSFAEAYEPHDAEMVMTPPTVPGRSARETMSHWGP